MALKCFSTPKSRKNPCEPSVAGIKAVGVAAYDSLKLVTTSGTGVTSLASVYSGSTIARLELKNTTVNYTENGATGGDNKSVAVVGSLPCVFNVAKGEDLATVKLINELIKGDVVLFIEGNDGSIRVAGSQFGAYVTTFVDQTGGQLGDLNGYTVTFETKEADLSRNYVLQSQALIDYATAIAPYV